MSHYHVERKRAAVDMFNYATQVNAEYGYKRLNAIELSSIASGGASKARIYEWLKQDLTEEGVEERTEMRGSERALTEDQERLLVGHAVSERNVLEPVSQDSLQRFCSSYLGKSLASSTISEIMKRNGMSSQKSMARSARLVSEAVADDALASIEDIRSFGYPPDQNIFMDETGLWSNVTNLQTYHFVNWYDIHDLPYRSRVY